MDMFPSTDSAKNAVDKSLIEMFEKKHINDDDYFQKYLKAHLDRGARMIYSEFKYSGDFVMALLNKDTTI